MRHFDIECSDKGVTPVPEQHVGRAQILAKHIYLGRLQDKNVRNVGITDRYPGYRSIEHHNARLIERYLHRFLETAANRGQLVLSRCGAQPGEQDEHKNGHPCCTVSGS